MDFVDYQLWAAAREMVDHDKRRPAERKNREFIVAYVTAKLTSRAIYPTPFCKGPPEPSAVSPALFVQNSEIRDDSEP